jgi:predicted nucleic acid-binding protein
MVVISDTTPLNYLIQIGSVEIIQRRFPAVTVSSAVIKELLHAKAPASVRAWAQNPPPWLTIREPSFLIEVADLGAGERAAISLGLETKADLVLMDDLAARAEAQKRNLRVAGTIGLIGNAHQRGWLDFDETIRKLRLLNYRIGEPLLADIRRSLY